MVESSVAALNRRYEPVNTETYDICVITAANEYQAQGYREQIKIRAEDNRLPEETQFVVISDPNGKRIGSGGSTIYVLYKLIEQLYLSEKAKTFRSIHDLLAEKRILILHSGGDSKRLPAYSASGKVFFPLPIDSFPTNIKTNHITGFVTLFDVLLRNLMQFPYIDEGQLVIASGDVLLSFDPSETNLSSNGVTGVAYPGSISTASSHGVYIPAQSESCQRLRAVTNFLQKPSHEQLVQNNALDASDRAFVDTGIVNFSLTALVTLFEASGIYIDNNKVLVKKGSLCDQIINGQACLDIYKEMPFAMLNHDVTISGFQNSASFVDAIKGIPFFVCLLSYCGFFHIGTSRQLLQNFHTINHTASIYGFQNFSRSKVKNESDIRDTFIYNSLTDTSSMKSGKLSFIESCYLNGNIDLLGENIITGIPKDAGDIKLKNGICITCIPVFRNNQGFSPSTEKAESGWVTVIYGVNDDFKLSVNDDSATFLNESLSVWIKENNIAQNDLWNDGDPHELWRAKLFPFNVDVQKSVATSVNIQNATSELRAIDTWKQSDRMSMEEILSSVDYKRFLDNQAELSRKIGLERLTEVFFPKSELSSKEILSWCKEPSDYRKAEERVLSMINETDDILFRARLYKLLSNIVHESSLLAIYQNPKSERIAYYEETAYNLVLKAIEEGLKSENIDLDHETSEPAIKIRSDEVVWACAPTRLDFAGGWSDTPPYCLEYGGSVLNASVKLNGQYPIQVIGKLYREPCIRINSIDLGENVIISDIHKMLSYKDPSDWTSLPKAAFITTGIIPKDMNSSLQEIINKLGSGIDLTLFSAVPSGSGLGTSSILGSAIIACLSRILGQKLTPEELFNRTMYMEQLMTTGGGWQDQIGGVVGGVKHIQTEPALFQMPKISWTDLKTKPDMDISERFLLYYTGYRRMAKNILRNIVGRYLDRDEATIKTIGQLRGKSHEMKEILTQRDINAFGKMISEVWKLNKVLDPGTSNENIESIIEKISHLIYGAKLLGAGGGGFLFIVTRGAEQSLEIKRILEENPPNERARFFDFDVDQEGLKISVL